MSDLSGRLVKAWISAVALLGGALLCDSTICSAQTKSGGVATLRVTSQLVTLDSLVADKKSGRIVQGLSAKDFQLSEDGLPQEIRYFSQDTLPLSIVLMFDLTDSVRPQLKSLGAGAEVVLTHLKPEDEVAVMTFDASARMLQPFTTDRALAVSAIREAATTRSGAPAFIDESMFEAIDEGMKATLPNSRRVLVWLTDDAANKVNSMSRGVAHLKEGDIVHTRNEAAEKLDRSGMVVAGLIEHSLSGDLMIGSVGLAMGLSMGGVQRYAELTGGPILKSSKKDTAMQLAALLEEIRRRDTLGYVPTAKRQAGTLCHIQLELSPEAIAAHTELKRGHYVVRTRSSYCR